MLLLLLQQHVVEPLLDAHGLVLGQLWAGVRKVAAAAGVVREGHPGCGQLALLGA